MIMRIAITTPNGNVGHHLTRMLLRAGIRPLLLSKNPETIDAELREYVDVARVGAGGSRGDAVTGLQRVRA
jgi:nucleoside-diphosphate-sugar epimerase